MTDSHPTSSNSEFSAAPLSDSALYGRTFWLAYLANMLLVMANGLLFRFAELVHHLGGNEQVAGDIVSLAVAIAVVMRLAFSHVIDDFGTRIIWPISASLFIFGCSFFLGCHQLGWMLYLARITYYTGLTGSFACSMTHIQQQVPVLRRTEIIGNLGSSGFVGMIAGANLGDVLIRTIPDRPTQFLALFGGATLIGIAYLIVVLVLTRDSQVRQTEHSAPAYSLLFRHWPGAVVLVAMIMGMGVTVTQVFLTRFATERGIVGIGWFFSGYAVAAFVFRISIQNASRSIGRHWMLVIGLVGHTIGHALLPYVTADWHFVIPAIVCGFGHALLFPAVVSLGSGAFPHEFRGTGTAVIMGFTDFGSLVCSPILGRIIISRGYEAMFWTSSFAAAATGVFYLIIALKYADKEMGEDKTPP